MNPIHSRKHISPIGATPIALGAITNFAVATAQDAPVNTAAAQVEIGSVVKAVYIEMWVRGDDEAAAPMNAAISFEKLEGSSVNMTFAQSTTPNVYVNKSNLFYMTQGLVSAGTANSAIPFMRGWFKVPKGFQRMAIGDRLVLNISALNGDLEVCGLFLFKEYQ